jgi:hypothetical protein
MEDELNKNGRSLKKNGRRPQTKMEEKLKKKEDNPPKNNRKQQQQQQIEDDLGREGRKEEGEDWALGTLFLLSLPAQEPTEARGKFPFPPSTPSLPLPSPSLPLSPFLEKILYL